MTYHMTDTQGNNAILYLFTRLQTCEESIKY